MATKSGKNDRGNQWALPDLKAKSHTFNPGFVLILLLAGYKSISRFTVAPFCINLKQCFYLLVKLADQSNKIKICI